MRRPQDGGNKRADILLGIVSFSPDFCGLDKSHSHRPDVFTSVVKSMKWIQEIVESEAQHEANQLCDIQCRNMCKSPTSIQRCMMACQLVSQIFKIFNKVYNSVQYICMLIS